MFKINDSVWSKVVTLFMLVYSALMRSLQPISLEAPAAETELAVSSYRQKADLIHVGLSWTEGLGKYRLSKVVTLAPRFLVINQLSETITFREHGVSPPQPLLIRPREQSAVLIFRSREEKLLTIAYPGLNSQW
jgi:vacuolar protein sorting-associated protein 13A/C